ALRGAQHIDTDIRGDPVEPGAQRRAPLEILTATPGAYQRLLRGVLGLQAGTEHPVAVGDEFLPVPLGLLGQIDHRCAHWRNSSRCICHRACGVGVAFARAAGAGIAAGDWNRYCAAESPRSARPCVMNCCQIAAGWDAPKTSL